MILLARLYHSNTILRSKKTIFIVCLILTKRLIHFYRRNENKIEKDRAEINWRSKRMYNVY